MITPAFALDFTTASVDPAVTFARALNTATRVNSAGYIETVSADTPRFDYNPISLACNGLLIEESRINLATYSEDFTNAIYTKTNSSVTGNADTAPSNTLTADKLVENTVNGLHFTQQVATVSNTTSYVVSVFAKAAGRSYIEILDPYTLRGATFNLSTGAITGPVTGGVSAATASSSQNMKNGWWRCSIVTTTTSTNLAIRITLATGTSVGNSTYLGNGTSGVLLWGAQMEAGAFATSYIPNLATGTTTRNADVATITGTNFSDFWQANRGGVLVRARPGTVGGTRPWVQFDDNTADNIIALRGVNTDPRLYVRTAGSDQADIDAGIIAANTVYNLNTSWNSNDCRARLNSGAMVSALLPSIPTVTQMRIGSDGTNYLNGHLEQIDYFDQIYMPGFSFCPGIAF